MQRSRILFSALILLSLIACKEKEQALESDWIQSPTVKTEDPAPTPTPTTTAPPAPTPTPTPTATTTVEYTGPAEVAPYVYKFVDDAKLQGVDVLPDMTGPKLEIQIASLSTYGSSVIGLCETGTNLRRVTFNPTFWNSVDETQRELLAHHELGHCVLYRDHRSDLLDSGAVASIMYPVIMSNSTYTNNYDYYQQELFTWGNAAAMAPGTIETKTHICNHENVLGR